MPTDTPSLQPAARLGILSSGLTRWRILGACLNEYQHIHRLGWLGSLGSPRCDAIAGWGYKPTSRRARHLAERLGVPYVAIEDGFLRSLGLGVEGFQPHSLVVDYSGIYYDASGPSDLETLIRDGQFSDDELARARQSMAQLAHLRLAKYNHAPDTPLPSASHQRVLVVDQTAGDASIHYGGASAETFGQMLDYALAESPDAEVLVKVHPDVIAGKKQGHLLEAARSHPRCRLIGENLNPWALLDAVDSAHVVTSQMGFEALIAGKSVTCHGLPFYAGWGLTRDQLSCPRRGTSRSLEQLFAAAYLRYCRYANPYTGEASTFEETIALIGDQKRQRDRYAGRWQAWGFSSWKRGFIGDFLGPAAQLRHTDGNTPEPAEQDGEHLLVWSNRVDDSMIADCKMQGTTLWRMEDGFLRSVGLGVDLTRPLSLVLDAEGIYYDATRPSELERLLNEASFDEVLLERAKQLRERLVRLGVSKYNVQGQPLPKLPHDKRLILVPGQVETDASIAKGSPEITTNAALLSAVRHANPDACVLYKPHPDVITGARLGALDCASKQLYDIELGAVAISDILQRVDEVHTMSSLTGFEALLRGRRVVTHGLPFYAGWGLTVDRLHCARRQRTLTLDALVAAALILYPGYVDPASGQLSNAETALTLMEQQRLKIRRLHWKTWLYRRYRNIFIGQQ